MNTQAMIPGMTSGGITRPSGSLEGRHGDASHDTDLAPGEESHHDIGKGIQGYLLGLVFAVTLTLASFGVVHSAYVWTPAIPVALIVFAIAQMGVHLVFFLHLTTGADNTNNHHGPRLRHPDRVPGGRRIPLDHGSPQRQT